MSDAPKKRPFFQIHLSTAIVLMFVAGGFLWLNVKPPVILNRELVQGPTQAYFELTIRTTGWPFHSIYCMAERGSVAQTIADGNIANANVHFAVANATACLILLFGTATFFEWLFRRQERRRE